MSVSSSCVGSRLGGRGDDGVGGGEAAGPRRPVRVGRGGERGGDGGAVQGAGGDAEAGQGADGVVGAAAGGVLAAFAGAGAGDDEDLPAQRVAAVGEVGEERGVVGARRGERRVRQPGARGGEGAGVRSAGRPAARTPRSASAWTG